jgi:peptidoglycan/LPS O-acetylase OafA/YrhL
MNSHIPQLDGLRGVAIAGVLAFHFHWFNLGWTGVVLFFVLSGYLITRILLESKHEQSYFGHFYARRALRIFPAYYLILALTFVFQRYFPLEEIDPSAASSVTEWPYFLLYVQNYWMGTHNFDTPLSQLLSFTWTLAVEEQFYLVWPLVVWLLGWRSLAFLCLMLVLAAPISRQMVLAASANPWFTLAAMSSHLDSLAAGALIAVVSRHEQYRRFISAKNGAALIVLGGIPLLALTVITGLNRYANTADWVTAPGSSYFLTFASVLFAGLLIVSLTSSGPLVQLLRARPLVALGKISYGVYVYHTLASVLVVTLARVNGLISFSAPIDPRLWFALEATGAALTLIAAALSYRFLEQPFLRMKQHFTRAAPVPAS